MGWTFECIIPGPPVGKGRPRATLRGGHIKMYSPKGSAEWERAAAMLARSCWKDAPLDEPCSIDVVAVMHRPKRLCRKRDSPLRLPCTSKPDLDNIVKSAMDALTMAGVLRDDSCVVRISASKFYSSMQEGPSVEITLSPLT